ncbi:MAG: NAD(P)H-hydrate dehydratase, partial [Clostridia bacterium]|nr:NAD(P)H-hydrate dehydratase [Clostridia bacterium]
GDGYSLAAPLADRMQVTVYDVFSAGQRSDAGKYWLECAKASGVSVLPLPDELSLSDFDIAVDAVFGTGFVGKYPERVIRLSESLGAVRMPKIAVDLPIGVNADTGAVEPFALSADVTVELSYVKVGLCSYPAREYCGEIILDTLGIEDTAQAFEFKNFLMDDEEALAHLPKREKNTSKGSFGRAALRVGSDKYRGAAHLALEGALRGGAGYVTFVGEPSLASELRLKFPEAIYVLGTASVSPRDVLLIGSGCECTEALADEVINLIRLDGAPLVLDADAINALAKYASADVLLEKSRKIILTPHPLEFSRISGYLTEYINAHRIECAREFAKKYGVTLLLKGAATVITDGEVTYINSTGSSALAKAGSGDVLAGLLASLLAQSPDDTLGMSALAAYLHGRAGDELEKELSAYAVTPSDIPKRVGEIIRRITK